MRARVHLHGPREQRIGGRRRTAAVTLGNHCLNRRTACNREKSHEREVQHQDREDDDSQSLQAFGKAEVSVRWHSERIVHILCAMSGNDFRDPVLLTGAGREGQVGEIVARTLAEAGATLLLVDRTAETARERATALTGVGFRAMSFGCDLADAAAVSALADHVRKEHGDRLSALVHVAGGFALSGSLAESDVETWHRMITINLTTAYVV